MSTAGTRGPAIRPPLGGTLEHWVAATTTPVMLTDAEGTVLRSSPGATRFIGSDPQGRRLDAILVGSDIRALLDRSRIDLVRDNAELAGADQDIVVFIEPVDEHRLVRLSVRGGTIIDDDLATELLEQRHRDAAHLRVEATLRARINDLDQLAGVLSHDLSAPARRVRQWAQIASEQAAEGHVDDALDAIARSVASSQQLTNMIEGLTTLLRTGRPPRMNDLSLDQVVRDALATIGDEIESAHAEIRTAELGTVRASGALITTIVVNLIVNAIRHARLDHPPVITIASARSDSEVVVTVTDNGPGIEPNLIDQATRAFWRGPTTGRVSGDGLGLSIARAAVEAMDGRLELSNHPDGGLCVAIVLPRDGAPPDRSH